MGRYLEDLKRSLLSESVEEDDDDNIEEMSVTGMVAGYDTPKAFGELDNDSIEMLGYKKAKKSKKNVKETSFAKISKELFIQEASYKDYKNDSSLSQKHKLNNAIKECNSQLFRIERALKQNKRLREEEQLGVAQYWKSSLYSLAKMNERISRIQEAISGLGLDEALNEISKAEKEKKINFILAANTELKAKDQWKKADLEKLDSSKLDRVYQNRIAAVPHIAKMYKVK